MVELVRTQQRDYGNFVSGGVGVFAGGFAPYGFWDNTALIDYVTISTVGTAKNFGNLSSRRDGVSSCSSKLIGVFFGGGNDMFGGSPTYYIEYITFATKGNASGFGTLINWIRYARGCSSSTKGISSGGDAVTRPGGAMETITFSTLGNSTAFGEMTLPRSRHSAFSSPTRGVFAGGHTYINDNYADTRTIDYVTIATNGNANNFGNLSVESNDIGGFSSDTRGVSLVSSDLPGTRRMEYVTIATLGDSTDFGSIQMYPYNPGACSSNKKGLFGGGWDPHVNVGLILTIFYISIPVYHDSSDIGSLSLRRGGIGACSNCHGGLQA